MLTLKQVRKQYRGAHGVVEALRDVSLTVPAGSFCAVMGPSGCGKSTLLHLVAGLDAVSAGDIELAGRSVIGLDDDGWTALRRTVLGMVFQAFHLLPGLTAAENVALPLLLRGESGPSVRSRVDEALDHVQLLGRADHRPGELSGGEQQRVAIARALVHRPALLLADEPTGNLDSRNGLAIVALLRSLSTAGGPTVLMATHSEAAASKADRVYRLRDGQLLKAA